MMTSDNYMDNEEVSLEKIKESITGEIITGAEKEFIEVFTTGGNDKYGRLFLSAFSVIPWIMPLSIMANLKAEIDQDRMNNAIKMWLKEHNGKFTELVNTINDILFRLDNFGDEVQERIESPEYINLVRQAFRVWDKADTTEKRFMIKQLLTNAGAITLCPDDQIRLFIDWIERYHESHFAVLKEIYTHEPITKGRMFDNLHPEGRPREDSAQAGLFGYLIRELNMGGIIHLKKQTNSLGQTMKVTSRTSTSRSNTSDTTESHFEDTKPWVLTALGKEFVRYVMEDIDPQLGMPDKNKD